MISHKQIGSSTTEVTVALQYILQYEVLKLHHIEDLQEDISLLAILTLIHLVKGITTTCLNCKVTVFPFVSNECFRRRYIETI